VLPPPAGDETEGASLAVVQNSFVSGEWLGKLKKAFRVHPQAKESLDLLEAEGMRSRTVLQSLYSYTHPLSQKHQLVLRSRAGKLATLLQRVEKLAKKVSKEIESSRPHFEISLPEWHSPELEAMHALEQVAEQIVPLKEQYDQVSSLRGKRRDESQLVCLCLVVQAITGRPHWADLAYLLEAAFLAHGHSEDWDEDSLRKIVVRFRKAHPILYDDMRVLSRFHHSPPVPQDSAKRSTRNRRAANTNPSTPTIHTLHPPTGH
jgi:hypothetical protein